MLPSGGSFGIEECWIFIGKFWEEFMKKILMAAVAAAFAVSGAAGAETTVKLAFIDALSGPFALTGERGLQNFTFAADYFVNNQGGIDVGGENVKFEILSYDGAEGFPSPKKSVLQAEKALRDGATFILQGNSSGAAAANRLRVPRRFACVRRAAGELKA